MGGFQPYLQVNSDFRNFLKLQYQTTAHPKYIRISRVGLKYQYFLKLPK